MYNSSQLAFNIARASHQSWWDRRDGATEDVGFV